MKYKFLIVNLFIVSLIFSQNINRKKKLQVAIEEFLNTVELKNAHIGISIRNLKSGKEIYNLHGRQNFSPASNLKLLYTLAAIDQKGKEFTYQTNLYYNGKIVNRMLFGDLIIQASGDPSFASIRMNDSLEKHLNAIVSRIKARNIRLVSGKLIMELNGWRYPIPGSIPVEDIGNYYGTGAWGFNFNDNRLDIYLQRNENENHPTKILFTKPQLSGITFVNKVVTAAPDTDDEAYIYAAPYNTLRYIMGTIPAGKNHFKLKAGMPNPPLSFLKILKEKLQQNGISIEDIQIKYTQNKYHYLLWQYTSKPLIDIVKTTNDYSINHFSEALAWLIIQKDKPADGYLDKQKINDFFASYGFNNSDIEDGSGLAPDNLIQPTEMTKFLKLMSDKLGKTTVLDILPHAGIDGYAKYYLQNSKWQKNVWVKSGSVSKIRNYSGIFKSKSGKYYSFSIMTNFFKGKHQPVKKAIEKLTETFIKAL